MSRSIKAHMQICSIYTDGLDIGTDVTRFVALKSFGRPSLAFVTSLLAEVALFKENVCVVAELSKFCSRRLPGGANCDQLFVKKQNEKLLASETTKRLYNFINYINKPVNSQLTPSMENFLNTLLPLSYLVPHFHRHPKSSHRRTRPTCLN